MSALKEELKVSLPSIVAGSFWIRKKKSSPCGPYFPGTFHSADVVPEHTLSRGPSWAKRPPRSAFFHKLWRKQTPAIARHPSTNHSCRDLWFTTFHTFQRFIQRNIGSLRCFSQGANLVSFLPRMLSSRVGSLYSSPASLAAFIFQKGFSFLGFLWLLHPHSPAHFFVGIIQLSPVFFFDAFVQRLTEGVPVIINQGRTPPLLFFLKKKKSGRHGCMTSTYPLPQPEASIHPVSPWPSPLGNLLILSAFVLWIFPCPWSGLQLQGDRGFSIFMNSLSPFVRPFLLLSPRPSPSFCWFANNLNALNKFPTKALRDCMRFHDLGLVHTFACLQHQEPVWLLPVVFFSTARAPPIVTPFSPRDPPNVVFQGETVAIRAQVGHRNYSLPSRWRDDASQIICASDHDFLHNAQLSCLTLSYLEGFLSSVKSPFRGFNFIFWKCCRILPSLHFSGEKALPHHCACSQCHRSIWLAPTDPVSCLGKSIPTFLARIVLFTSISNSFHDTPHAPQTLSTV